MIVAQLLLMMLNLLLMVVNFIAFNGESWTIISIQYIGLAGQIGLLVPLIRKGRRS